RVEMTSATSCFLTAESQQQLSRSSGRRWTFCFRVHLSVHLSASMRAPVCAALLLWVLSDAAARRFSEEQMAAIRQRIRSMFYHAYNSYLNNAFPYDELRPLTCDGQDTWGSFSLTLIDALDTLLVLGNRTEFQRVASLLQDTVDFDIDVNASVFETNIRVVGGLLSAHLLAGRAGMELEPGWPCSGPLLRMAQDAARKLLPAFETPTGMPYGTVNLMHGVSPTETPVTCTAGVGTFILEFAALSRLTGDPTFENAARRALTALWKTRSDIGLVTLTLSSSTRNTKAVRAQILFCSIFHPSSQNVF
ncbi:ER degradation-enhancing alpha-mannosidase-like protein 2, partial [Goodea atripinnis]